MPSFRNLDSFAISVVLSVAYRNSARLACHGRPGTCRARPGRAASLTERRGAPAPAIKSRQSIDTGGRARHGERRRRAHSRPGPGQRRERSTATERSDRTDGSTLKARPRDDDDQIDPDEYARLLDVYDNSFRNIAEGEVVKGTVLKVTASEVIVDVGYKSEGIIAARASSSTRTARSPSRPATSSTCCSSAPKIAKATSSSRAKKPRR